MKIATVIKEKFTAEISEGSWKRVAKHEQELVAMLYFNVRTLDIISAARGLSDLVAHQSLFLLIKSSIQCCNAKYSYNLLAFFCFS